MSLNYPVVYHKRPLKQRIRYFIASKLIDLAWDIDDQAFDDFACDNGYGYCHDCDGVRLK